MKKDKAFQSFNISSSQISNVQIGGQAGNDLIVTQAQQINETSTEKLTLIEIKTLLDRLKSLVQESNLPVCDKEKVIRSVETVKDEIQTNEPDKEFAAKSLQRATKILKGANETVEAGTSLWKKVEPILKSVRSWLGVVTSFLI